MGSERAHLKRPSTDALFSKRGRRSKNLDPLSSVMRAMAKEATAMERDVEREMEREPLEPMDSWDEDHL